MSHFFASLWLSAAGFKQTTRPPLFIPSLPLNGDIKHNSLSLEYHFYYILWLQYNINQQTAYQSEISSL